MATTEEATALTEAYRRLMGRLRLNTATELAAIMPLLEFSDIKGTWPPVEAAVTRLIQKNRRIATRVSMDYFGRYRRLEGISTPFTAIPGPALDLDQLTTNLRITGPGKAGELFRTNRPNIAQGTFVSLNGEAQRNVVNAARETQLANVAADRECIGWIRVSDGDPCAFCAMLISRGPNYKTSGLYKSKASATSGKFWSDKVNDFRAHANCGCTAEPIYSDTAELPQRAQEYADIWNNTKPDPNIPGDTVTKAFRREIDRLRREGQRLTAGLADPV
jgi:hypothetical protein